MPDPQRDIFLLMKKVPFHRCRHYKGDFYKVICVGRLSELRDEIMVVYESEKTRYVWIRPLGMFIEPVEWPDGLRKPRFVSVNSEGEEQNV